MEKGYITVWLKKYNRKITPIGGIQLLATSLKKDRYMTLTLPILKIKFRTIVIIPWIIFLICGIIAIIGVSYPEFWTYFGKFRSILGILTGVSAIAGIILPLILVNYLIIGSICIDNSMIRIFENDLLIKEYSFDKIRQIKFEFNETAMDGGYGVRLGINNRIYITDLVNNVDKYTMKIENQHLIRFIDERLDSLKDIEVIKMRKGKIVKRLQY